MLHTCVQRFDVTGNLKNFAKFLGTEQGLRKRTGSVATEVMTCTGSLYIFRACLLEVLKLNKHGSTFVLFDKKIFNFGLIRLNRFVS
jgi:hypothetical protein